MNAKPRTRVRLKEVAERNNLTVSTVSRVLAEAADERSLLACGFVTPDGFGPDFNIVSLASQLLFAPNVHRALNHCRFQLKR